MVEVSASVLNINEKDATHTFYELEVAKVDYFHIDVMDGNFVENDTTQKMKDYALTLSHITNLGLDVHLMVKDIEYYIDEYIELEPEYITFHIEASENKERTLENIKTIKENGIKAGLAISPSTSVQEILEYIPYIHLIIVMTVVPGKGGQKLIPETLEKVRALRKYITENKFDTLIETDGGINSETILSAKDAGADIVVSGKYLIDSKDMKETVEKLKAKF